MWGQVQEKRPRTKKEKKKKKYSGQQQKEIDCDEPHPAPNEKTQPIRWTERPTGALVAAGSLQASFHLWTTEGNMGLVDSNKYEVPSALTEEEVMWTN